METEDIPYYLFEVIIFSQESLYRMYGPFFPPCLSSKIQQAKLKPYTAHSYVPLANNGAEH